MSAGEFRIPSKLYFRIGEVSEITGVQPYTLRHWEMEFPTLKPRKNEAGQRLYRKNDIEMVRKIQHLLHEEGYTTAGARRYLQSGRPVRLPPVTTGTDSAGSKPPSPKAESGAIGKKAQSPAPQNPPVTGDALRGVQEALDLMKRNDEALARLLGSEDIG